MPPLLPAISQARAGHSRGLGSPVALKFLVLCAIDINLHRGAALRMCSGPVRDSRLQTAGAADLLLSSQSAVQPEAHQSRRSQLAY